MANVPVNCSALWSTRVEAQQCQTAPIELRNCRDCDVVFNSLFRLELVEYNARYDNSLDFSEAFQSYTRDLSAHLAATYHLEGKSVVEIGCGNGTFLKVLCDVAGSTGIGYDPSFPGHSSPASSVRFVDGYFSQTDAAEGFDFLVCRHVLEHIPKPLDFLKDLLQMSVTSPAANFYFEVPNGGFVLNGDGLWDVIYPHVSYFTENSLRSLFERAGFDVLAIGKTFSDQFLFVEARRGSGTPNGLSYQTAKVTSEADEEPSAFWAHFDRSVLDWSDCLARLMATRKPFFFWGAGAKGVTFLNLVPGAKNIGRVIDSNPRKQLMFVPGTGQRIMSPEVLKGQTDSFGILLNAAYKEEISAQLAAQGVKAILISDPNFVPQSVI